MKVRDLPLPLRLFSFAGGIAIAVGLWASPDDLVIRSLASLAIVVGSAIANFGE